jgi:protein-S-isoprenylcysteine O-methyltransferase Ste14
MYLVRHLIAVLILPFTVVVLVPWLLLQSGPPIVDRIATNGIVWTVVGGAVFLVGLSGFMWCVFLFGSVGHGTLAPWDPTQDLVAQGPYRYTRNPMISSVAAMLAGEALLFRSSSLTVWLLVFIAVNHVYFVASEEPGLEKRFGEAYANYKIAVPRWIPRVPR